MRKFYLTVLGLLTLFVLIINSQLSSAPLKNVPIKLKQPDGTILNVYASGDEFYNWVHDKDNYTILPDPKTGFYVYAEVRGGKLVPTENIVGKVDPKSAGLKAGANVFPEKRLNELKSVRKISKTNTLNKTAAFPTPDSSVVGNRFNLIIFIRFKDEVEFTDSLSKFNDVLNNPNGPSLKHFYKEASYNQLDVTSYFCPQGPSIISYQDIQNRNYYMGYDSINNPNGYTDDGGTREMDLLKRALEYVKPQIPAGINLDGNNDGFIDNVTFIVSGSPEGWANLLWPHRGSYSYYDQNYAVTINGKQIQSYDFELQNWCDYSVFAHEMGHSFGLPDLYRYSNEIGDASGPVVASSDASIDPVGPWDLMASCIGHMDNYLKWKYLGWIKNLPEINQSGTYWIKKSTSTTKNIYLIKSPRSPQEFFILEYRSREGLYEINLPGSGLLVYRINSSESENGNAFGPPDEIYLYRPYGTLTIQGALTSANFGSDFGRTEINDLTDPSGFLSDGFPGGLSIKNIGAVGDSIKFDVEIVGNLTNNGDYTIEKTAGDWVDISQTGTKITNWINGNSQDPDIISQAGYTGSAIPLGFDFNFYGQKFDSIFVGVDGLASFTYQPLCYFPPGSQCGYFATGLVWPGNTNYPNSIAAAYDSYFLSPSGVGNVYYKTVGDKFVLSWLNAYCRYSPPGNTFQLVLNKSDNSIAINFEKFDCDDTRKEVLVGIQKDQSMGISISNPGDAIDRTPENNTSIIFKPKALCSVITVSSPSEGGNTSGGGSFSAGQSAKFTLTATPNDSYQFVDWTEGGAVVSTNAKYSFTATTSRSLAANFKVLPLFTVEPTSVDVPGSGGNFQIKLSNKHFSGDELLIIEYYADADWISIASDNSIYFADSAEWAISCSKNAGANRTGNVIIIPDSIAGGPKKVEIKQAGVTGTDNAQQDIPKTYLLANNYPNPFNPGTIIKYGLPKECYVKITVHDILGREVLKLVDGMQNAGYYQAILNINSNGHALASGVYFYRMTAGDFTQTRKMIILK